MIENSPNLVALLNWKSVTFFITIRIIFPRLAFANLRLPKELAA
jgi:hypothetical protein